MIVIPTWITHFAWYLATVFKPAYQEMFELAHQSGKFVFFIVMATLWTYTDFIDMGVSAINSSYGVWGAGGCCQYASRITFWGDQPPVSFLWNWMSGILPKPQRTICG